AHAPDRLLQRGHVAQVAVDEARRRAACLGDALAELVRCRVVDVDEGDLRLLRAEMPDDRGADAGAAAGDEDDLVAQAGVARKPFIHSRPPPFRDGHPGRQPARPPDHAVLALFAAAGPYYTSAWTHPE